LACFLESRPKTGKFLFFKLQLLLSINFFYSAVTNKLWLLVFTIISFINTGAVASEIDRINYYEIDQYALGTPDNHRSSLISLTNYLVKPYATEQAKARSIYAWIVYNLTYDKALAKRKYLPKTSIKHILKTKRAVCSGYSQLFKEMCDIAGLECEIIVGYSSQLRYEGKRRNRFANSDHAWNAVKIEGEWYLLDATWERKTKLEKSTSIGWGYFLVDPTEFVKDHLPEVPYWQLLSCPITLEDFKLAEDGIKDKAQLRTGCISFQDTIIEVNQLQEAHKSLRMGRDAFLFNPKNHLTYGLAHFNFGTHLANLTNQQNTTYAHKIENLTTALGYYNTSLKHFRKSKKKKYLLTCKKRITSTKASIKSLKIKNKKLEKSN
jgi:hypothetical protein